MVKHFLNTVEGLYCDGLVMYIEFVKIYTSGYVFMLYNVPKI